MGMSAMFCTFAMQAVGDDCDEKTWDDALMSQPCGVSSSITPLDVFCPDECAGEEEDDDDDDPPPSCPFGSTRSGSICRSDDNRFAFTVSVDAVGVVDVSNGFATRPDYLAKSPLDKKKEALEAVTNFIAPAIKEVTFKAFEDLRPRGRSGGTVCVLPLPVGVSESDGW